MNTERLACTMLATFMLAAGGPAPMGRDEALAYLRDNSIDPLPANVPQRILIGDARGLDALIAAGVDVNAPSDLPQSPLELAAMSCSGQRVAPDVTLHMVNALLAAGAPANAPGIQGLSPLMIAAQQCDGSVVQRLIAAGAPITSKTPQGFTPLSMALIVKNYSAAEALLDAGARLDAASGRKLTTGSDDARLKALVARATGS